MRKSHHVYRTVEKCDFYEVVILSQRRRISILTVSYIMLCLLIFTGCGGGSGASIVSTTGEGVNVIVKNSASFNPNIEHGRITKYRITVTAPDIATPIVAEFDGSATSGLVTGVPVGEARQVIVEAVNSNDSIIRQGEEKEVSVEGGATANVEVSLESVPIFTNLAEGNTIDNTRLVFQVFSEPSGSIIIEDVTNSPSFELTDAATMSANISFDISSGLGRMAPKLQPIGQHKYLVKNTITNRSSAVTVNLTDGAKKRAAPFFAGGENSLKRKVSWGVR